jgi:hypothetical protein
VFAYKLSRAFGTLVVYNINGVYFWSDLTDHLKDVLLDAVGGDDDSDAAMRVWGHDARSIGLDLFNKISLH